jgi:ABC-type polysaccharide/polyol phosphate export permease
MLQLAVDKTYHKQLEKIASQLQLILVLAKTEFKSKYKTAYFGFAWMLITPIIQMVVITSVFSNFFQEANYANYVLIGLICWQFISTTISLSAYSITGHADLLHKTKMTAAAIPVASVLSSGFNFVTSLAVVGAIFVMWGYKLSIVGLLSIMAAIIWLLCLAVFLSILTSSLYVFFRDIGHAIQSIIMIWFYASPIIWTPSHLPQTMQFILNVNPIAAPLSLMRFGFGHQSYVDQQMILANIILTAVITVISIVVYKKTRPYFVDYV